MSDISNNEWGPYAKLVLNKIKEYGEKHDATNDRLGAIELKLVKLETKLQLGAGLFGFIAGIIGHLTLGAVTFKR